MSLSEILNKIRSSEKRDALAREFWILIQAGLPEYEGHAYYDVKLKPYTYTERWGFEQVNVIEKSAYDAAKKENELLLALCERLRYVRDSYILRYVAETTESITQALDEFNNIVLAEDKKLAELAERMMEG